MSLSPEELQALRDTVKRLRGYQKGQPPQMAESFPKYVQDELGLKVAPTLQNLINVIKSLDARLTELEGP